MKTKNFVVNNAGDPEAVTVITVCRQVTVGEDESVAGYPTTAFNVRKPAIADTPRRVGTGKSYTFKHPSTGLFWQPGDIVGYLDTVDVASSTFYQDEE